MNFQIQFGISILIQLCVSFICGSVEHKVEKEDVEEEQHGTIFCFDFLLKLY
jgi:hypothetical protein